MIKNNKGLTLIELLAVIALFSFILLLAISIYLFGQKNFVDQREVIDNQSNVRLAANIITRDIRRAEDVVIINDEISLNGVDEYKLEGTNITKNGNMIVRNVDQFAVSLDGNKVTIEIISVPSVTGQTASISTEIFLRE